MDHRIQHIPTRIAEPLASSFAVKHNTVVEIPHITTHDDWYAKSPGWSGCRDTDGKQLKPIIRCNCGQWSGIGLHHVHADGTVTASFFHATKAEHPQGDDSGCGWHVFLKLLDYDQGDFPPTP